MSTAAQNGILSLFRIVTQTTNVGLTISHFAWAQSHSDEVTTWSFLYYTFVFPMMALLLADFIFYFYKVKGQAYDMAQGFTLFDSFLFAASQASEIANYNMDNSFPLWQLALMLSLNLFQMVSRVQEVL